MQLCGGEITVHDQPGALLDVFPVLLCQRVRRGGGAAILPHDGGVYRLAGILIPHQARLSLIGKADAADLLPADTGVPHGLLRRFQQTVKDLLRDVLDPPRLGKELPVFVVASGYHAHVTIQQKGGLTRCALI